MNLPNKLTILRILLTFAFIVFLFVNGVAAKITALLVFILASATDVLDGFLAKRNNQITDFGKLMDPIADKILVLSAFLSFVEIGVVQAWMVIVIVFREVVITGLRLLALSKRVIIPADDGGKHKTVWQVGSIVIVLLFLIFSEGGSAVFKFWNTDFETYYKNFIFFVMLITVSLTLASGLAYLWKNKEVYLNAKEH